MGNAVLFIILATIAIVSALGMLLSKNAIYSALYLVLNFATIAVFYLILNAPFIAMVQVTVYAGAIMVLFLFVIMLLGAERLGIPDEDNPLQQILAPFLALILTGTFIVALMQDGTNSTNAVAIDTSPTALGMRLFEAYLLPFEVTGVLLLTAVIGLVILHVQKKKKGGTNA